MLSFFSEYITDTLALFYPKICGACDAYLLKGEEQICFSCSNNLPKTDFEFLKGNPVELLFQGRVKTEFVTSYLYFSKYERTQQILHNIKYNQRKQLAVYFGQLMGQQLLPIHQQLNFDVIIPVPLHEKKLKLRGYNQSELIAKGIANILDCPLETKQLIRTTHTASQTKKNRVERWENLQSAFSLTNSEKLKNKHCLIVDDVLTTGATLESCANTLLTVENIKISFATLAFAF